MNRRDPVALIVGTEPHHHTVLVRCPYCRRRHRHTLWERGDRHRAAPCGTPGGYWIVQGRELMMKEKEIHP